ncbi:MAG TPA: hypothetical protein VF918_25105, partial [Anaerolineales bacterium]
VVCACIAGSENLNPLCRSKIPSRMPRTRRSIARQMLTSMILILSEEEKVCFEFVGCFMVGFPE